MSQSKWIKFESVNDKNDRWTIFESAYKNEQRKIVKPQSALIQFPYKKKKNTNNKQICSLRSISMGIFSSTEIIR